MTMAKRLKGMGQVKYQRDGDPRTSGPGFGLSTHPDTLDLPLRWRKPRRVFVNSMSDLFHKNVPGEFIAQVFAVMAATPQHTYQILTKRHGRMQSLLSSGQFADLVSTEVDGGILDWTTGPLPASSFDHAVAHVGQRELAAEPLPALRNAHLGVSVEDQKHAELRLPALRTTPAVVRFISAEPLLGHVDVSSYLSDGRISWVIVGGESGPGARPMKLDWARSLVDQCRAAGVPAFVKQLGTVAAGGGKGGDMDAWPEDLRIRQFPAAAS